MCPNKTLEKLIDGNKRFAQNKSIHPNLGNELRNKLVSRQKPFAAILSCSDSRVPVEIIFDAGLGDLFVVRTAGHVLSSEVMGSLEYAVKALGVKLIMILGHENCGAISTALEAYQTKTYDEFSSNIQAILNHIYPAIEKTKGDDLLNCAVKSNIFYQIEDLINKDDYIANKIKKGEIALVGAMYSLSSGLIEVLK